MAQGRDRDKPTWRDRDARSGTKPRDDRDRPDPSPAGYRAQLEKLFATGGIAKLVSEREKAQAEGRDHAKVPLPGESTTPIAERIPGPAAPTPAPAAAATAEPAKKGSRKKKVEAEPTRLELLERVRNAVGRDEITKVFEVYLAKHGWPEDFDALCQVLEHRNLDRIGEALGNLERMLGRGDQPRRRGSLLARLKSLEETSGDPELGSHAARVHARLG